MRRLRDTVAGTLCLLIAACGGDSTGPGGAAGLHLAAQSVPFGLLHGGPAPAPETVEVRSTGADQLTGVGVGSITYAAGTGWLSATLDRTTTPATLSLAVAGGALEAGRYTATVPINAAKSSNGAQSLQVTLLVLDASGTTTLATAGESKAFLDSPKFGTQLALSVGSEYLIGVINTNPSYTTTENFTIAGALVGAGGVVQASRAAPKARELATLRTYAMRRPDRAALTATQLMAARHVQTLERNRQIYARRGNPQQVKARLRSAARLAPIRAAAISQTVGMVNKVYVAKHLTGSCTDVDSIGARTVAVGQHVIVLADTNLTTWPNSQRPDSGFYDSFAQEYDQVTWPHIQSYAGDPLAYDASLSGTGKVTVTITPELNNLGGGVLGFVDLCDFFPFADSGPDADYSNETEMLYSWVPSSNGLPVSFWKQSLRAVAAHETKHIVSFSDRIINNSPVLEELWLEEGLAQQTEEAWLRHFNLTTWKGSAGFDQTVACELDLGVAEPCGTGNPLALVLSHLPFLFNYLQHGATEGLGKDVPSIYGAGWSFSRWATDQYASDEAVFVKSLINEPQLSGLANLSSHTGQPIPLLLVYWNLATAIYQDMPRDNIADPRMTLPTFDLWDIFRVGQTELTCGGVHCGLFTDTGLPIFPVAPAQVTAGSFVQTVTGLPGTGATYFLLSGTATQTQAVELLDGNGQAISPGSGLRVAVVRVR